MNDRRPNGTGHIDKHGYLTHSVNSRNVRAHRLIVEKILGRPLPAGAVVHHVNGDRLDNRPENLVVCPSQEYHRLLHTRQTALEACGHADWLKCRWCGQYDSPENLSMLSYKRTGTEKTRALTYHLSCNKDAGTRYRKGGKTK